MPRASPTLLRASPVVQVRPFVPDDVEPVLALIARNRERFHQHGLNRLPQVAADFDGWTRSVLPRNERMLGLFEQDRCVGFVGVLTVQVGRMPVPGIGLWYGLDRACEGRGLATEGVRQALRWYAALLGPDVPPLAMVHCRIPNRRSARLAQRLGMQRDPSIDYIRHDGGRSAPRMIGFSMPIDQAWAMANDSVVPVEPVTTSPRRRPR